MTTTNRAESSTPATGGDDAASEQRCEDLVEGRGAFVFAEDERLDAGAVGGGADGRGELGIADTRGGV